MASHYPSRMTDAIASSAHDTPSSDIELDPVVSDRQRAQRHYRYNVQTLPITRLLGFNAVVLGAIVLSHFAMGGVNWDVLGPLIVVVEAYCLLSWLALRWFWQKAQPFDLQIPLLVIDLFVWAALIYASGAERSWLFFILIIRAADQSYTSFRRALVFAHLAPAVYLLMLAYVEIVDGRSVPMAAELAKVLCVYGACLYLALTGRTAAALRGRTLAAIRLAKGLIGQLEEKSRLVQEKSVQLEESSRKAESANVAKSQFLANMSHELRTPLNAIIGYTEMLLEDQPAHSTTAADLDNIRSASKHLLSLIDDVLDIAKIEAGRMSLHLDTFEVEPLLHEVVRTVEPLMRRNGNRLELAIGGELGTMRADQTRLRQMLLNVLGNASKFTEGGTVMLIVQRERAPSGDVMVFAVRDTGIGMSVEEQGRLFQPFSQADASTTRRYGGSGLGLVITKHFAEQMGGNIYVESAPSVGTTFTIRVPAAVSPRLWTPTSPLPAQRLRHEETHAGITPGRSNP